MNVAKIFFAQYVTPMLWTTLSRIVPRYGGDFRVRGLTSTWQFLAMALTPDMLRGSAGDRNLLSGQLRRDVWDPPDRLDAGDAKEGRDWRI